MTVLCLFIQMLLSPQQAGVCAPTRLLRVQWEGESTRHQPLCRNRLYTTRTWRFCGSSAAVTGWAERFCGFNRGFFKHVKRLLWWLWWEMSQFGFYGFFKSRLKTLTSIWVRLCINEDFNLFMNLMLQKQFVCIRVKLQHHGNISVFFCWESDEKFLSCVFR